MITSQSIARLRQELTISHGCEATRMRVRDLLEVGYLRKDDDSRLTMSPIRTNALEAAQTSGVDSGAVVCALPLEMAAFLTDLQTGIVELRSAK